MNILENKKTELRVIIKREIFYFFSAALLSFYLLEIIAPNFVLAYFNLNYLWLAWLTSGLINVIKKQIL